MKKTFKLIGIIAIVAIIAVGFVACDNGITDDPPPPPASKITFTNISELNGSRVIGAMGEDITFLSSADYLLGASTPTANLQSVMVSGGTVTLNVYKTTDGGATWSLYTGNDTFDSGKILLCTVTNDSIVISSPAISRSFLNTEAITFANNGVATVNFSTQMEED